MIVTENFVLMHMHKTGGQSLSRIVQNCIPGHQIVGYHYPLDMLPEAYVDLPVVGMVRNPWDWYVSWYAFNQRPTVKNMLFDVLSDGGHVGFKETVTNLVNLGSMDIRSGYYRRCLELVFPETLHGNRGVGLRKEDVRSFQGEAGYCSWLFERMHGAFGSQNMMIGRFENLEEDFLKIMESLAVSELAAIRQMFASVGRQNVSSHNHYSQYYDDELRILVAEMEQPLIDEFGYVFEDLKGVAVPAEFPVKETHTFHPGFDRALGKSKNFRLLATDYDVEPIAQRLSEIPVSAWLESARHRRYEAHRNTEALHLIYDSDFRHYNPTCLGMLKEFESEMNLLIELVSHFYGREGFIVRLIFTKLKAHKRITLHKDKLYTLINSHRVHIPIVTNDQITFMVGGEEKQMKVGEVWEINNATFHRVMNESDEDRIHLILDWVPNITLREGDVQ